MLSEPPVPAPGDTGDALHADLLALLEATRIAERDLFARFDDEAVERPMPGDSWSPRDVLGHLAAWRAIEARRLAAEAGDPPAVDDPQPGDPVDESNARLQAERAGRSRAEVEAEADASLTALADAVQRSSHDALCECDQLVAGIGANGINHAIGHLGDVARLVDDEASFIRLADAVERVLERNHLPPRDSAVMLYNLACHRALSAELADARRLLRAAFGRRRDLLEWARTDPDVAALHEELDQLAST